MRREDGHDSIDDAKARPAGDPGVQRHALCADGQVSLELARLKFARGPSFGAAWPKPKLRCGVSDPTDSNSLKGLEGAPLVL